MKLFIVAAALTLALVSGTTQFLDAPTGFDNKTNGIVDDGTHQADQMKFDEVEKPMTRFQPSLFFTPFSSQRPAGLSLAGYHAAGTATSVVSSFASRRP